MKNKINNPICKFVNKYHEFIDEHDVDRTLNILKALKQSGHITIQQSETTFDDWSGEVSQ